MIVHNRHNFLHSKHGRDHFRLHALQVLDLIIYQNQIGTITPLSMRFLHYNHTG